MRFVCLFVFLLLLLRIVQSLFDNFNKSSFFQVIIHVVLHIYFLNKIHLNCDLCESTNGYGYINLTKKKGKHTTLIRRCVRCTSTGECLDILCTCNGDDLMIMILKRKKINEKSERERKYTYSQSKTAGGRKSKRKRCVSPYIIIIIIISYSIHAKNGKH